MEVPDSNKTTIERELDIARFFSRRTGLGNQECAYMDYALAESKLTLINKGDIYFNWQDAEEYINKIMEHVKSRVPDTLGGITKVFLNADAEFNAYAMYDGTILFNVGGFLNLENEAEIAAILSHEYAHYLLQHMVKGLVVRVKANYEDINSFRKRKGFLLENLAYSRTQEREADSLGFLIMCKTDYDPKYFVSAEEKLKLYEEGFKRFASIRSQSSKISFRTHPLGELRVSYATNWLSRIAYDQKKAFLVSEKDFLGLKKKARVECLDQFLKNGDFILCSEMAFMSYLTDTSENSNIYYLMESLRKFMFSANSSEKALFLSEFYSLGASLFRGTAIQGLFSKPIMERLGQLMDSSQIDKIVQDKYLLTHTNEIRTNSDAFNYFLAIAKKRKITETYLLAALYYKSIGTPRYAKEYLDLYLKDELAYYPEFANYLNSFKYRKKTKSKSTLVVLNSHIVNEYKNKIEVFSNLDYPAFQNELKALIESKVKGNDFVKVVTVDELYSKKTHIGSQAKLLDQVINWSDPEQYRSPRSTSVIYFDPAFYYNLIDNDPYKKIIFLNVYDFVNIPNDAKLPITTFESVDFIKRNVSKFKLEYNPMKKFKRSKFRIRKNRIRKKMLK
jgi:hypothetical protein